MGFWMKVRIDEVLNEGIYRAVLENVEEKDTKFGERLMWTFRLLDQNAEVVGFTSMSPSTKANAYLWAAAITGQINPTTGWGPEDVIGGECVVFVKATEDAQGTKKNKVVKVKPPRKSKTGSADSPHESGDTEGDVVQIPL